MKVYTFTATDWFHGHNLGEMADISADQTKQLVDDGIWDPVKLTNNAVIIDNHEYHVAGVETHAIDRGPNHPYQQSFAILITGKHAKDDAHTTNPGRPGKLRIHHNREQEQA